MIFRTFTLSPLPLDLQTDSIKETLTFSDSGAVADYNIDDDYMVTNNSSIKIVADTKAVAGQIIVMIEDSGVYALGVISSVDNEQKIILYRSIISLFDDNILNSGRPISTSKIVTTPEKTEVIGDTTYITPESTDTVYTIQTSAPFLYDGIIDTAVFLQLYFTGNIDKYRRLPLVIRTSGGGKNADGSFIVPAIWSNTDNQVNVKSWLIGLFDSHNVVIQPRLVFEISRAYIELYIFKNSTGGRLIKDNIAGMNLTHSEETTAAATVCKIIYSDTKDLVDTYYLLINNTVTNNIDAPNRLQPYKLIVAEMDRFKTEITPQIVAENALKYKEFSHYISVIMNRESRAFPTNLQIGDAVKIVPNIHEMLIDTPIKTDFSDYVIDSIYTGRKESSKNNLVTLTFGKIRINYTDIIQMQNYQRVRN